MKKNNKRKKVKIIAIFFTFLFICLLGTNNILFADNTKDKFIHTEGTVLVDADGNQYIMKSMGFYNGINKGIYEKNGAGYGYLINHNDEESYKELSELGFNCVRFYLDYRFFYTDSTMSQYNNDWMFEIIDQNISWAKKYNIKLQLDMHSQPEEIWTDESVQDTYARLLGKIANRYKDETTIIGYGLKNEPDNRATDTLTKNQNLYSLYCKCIKEIRSVDQNHILFIEKAYELYKDGLIIPDDNWIYEAHFYSTLDFTHQGHLDSPTGFTYPDENITMFCSGFTLGKWGNGNNETINDNEWHEISVEEIIGQDYNTSYWQLCASNSGEDTVAYVKNIVIEEYDKDKNLIGEIYSYSFDSEEAVNLNKTILENSNGFAGDAQLSYDDITDSLKITGKYGSLQIGFYVREYIEIKQGNTYKIKANIKVINSSVNYKIAPRLNIGSCPLVTKFNKDFLDYSIKTLVDNGKEMAVPYYAGEFGTTVFAYEDNRGADKWISDLIDIFDKYDVNFNFHDYHGGYNGFSLHNSESNQLPKYYPDETDLNMTLYNIFKTKLKNISISSQTTNSLNLKYNIIYENNKTKVNFYVDNDANHNSGYLYTYGCNDVGCIGSTFEVTKSQKVLLMASKYDGNKSISGSSNLDLVVVKASMPAINMKDNGNNLVISLKTPEIKGDTLGQAYYNINNGEFKEFDEPLTLGGKANNDIKVYYITNTYGVSSEIYSNSIETFYEQEDNSGIENTQAENTEANNAEINNTEANNTETNNTEENEKEINDTETILEDESTTKVLDSVPYTGDSFIN